MLTAGAVKAKARELGFDLCGIAAADNFRELKFLDEWLARGYAGEMAWMSRSADRRADVRNVVPGARSVVVTGTIYNTGSDPGDDSTQPLESPHHRGLTPVTTHHQGLTPAADQAAIARYARGEDYHDVLKTRLDSLLAWMRAASPEPFDARAYVDTGPVQERVYAQYAGLGWTFQHSGIRSLEFT